ncbi:MAG TPA: hydrogenase 4 subunit B, partial [bacterium]|nr:hydrogenase 4 subunit B [bacterium]
MNLLLLSLGLLLAGSFFSLFLGRSSQARTLGAATSILGCVAGIVPACSVLLGGLTETFASAWEIPMGIFAVRLDPLSAFFVLTIL